MIPETLVDKIKWSSTAGELLRIARKEQKKSMKSVAEEMGCSQAYILDIEKAKNSSLSLKTVKGICEALSLELDDFLINLLKKTG